MSRVLLSLFGAALLLVTALCALWLAGQLLLGLGAALTGAAGVLLKLLWFGTLAALLGGVSYFIAQAWRPGSRTLPPLQKTQAVASAPLSTVVVQAEPQVVVTPSQPAPDNRS